MVFHFGPVGARWLTDHFQEAAFDLPAQVAQGQVVGILAEGIFQLGAQGFEGQEGVGDEADDDGRHQADGIEQTEGQPEAVQVDAAVDDDGVGKGNGVFGNALAAGQRGAEFIEVAPSMGSGVGNLLSGLRIRVSGCLLRLSFSRDWVPLIYRTGERRAMKPIYRRSIKFPYESMGKTFRSDVQGYP